MKRTVTRRWTNKKTGEARIKSYTYEDRKGATLVDKRGIVRKKAVEEFKAAIDATDSYTEDEKRKLKEDIDNRVRVRAGKKNKPLTTTGFMGMQEDDAIDRMFTNIGMSVEEVAEAYKLNPADIRDPSNWNGNILTIGKVKYQYKVKYRGEILEVIK